MALTLLTRQALESSLTEPSAYTEIKRVLEGTGYEALGDAAVTIASTTTIAVCTADAGSSRAGSDDFVGAIFTSKEGNAAGDGDIVAVTDGTVAITVVDDVNPGSVIDFHCAVAGQWIVTGQLVVDAVASVPTIA